MLSITELNEGIEQAVLALGMTIGPDKTKDLMSLIADRNNHVAGLIHAVALEISMSAGLKGLTIAKEARSILEMPEGAPILVKEDARGVLAVVIPNKGKYLLPGSLEEVDIKPDVWYDINIYGGSDEEEELKDE